MVASVIALCGSCAMAEPADPNAGQDADAKAIADFLKAHALEGRVALIEFGMIGCEKSEQGLDAMIELARAKTIPGLAFARVEAASDKSVSDPYYKKKKPGFPVVMDPKTTIARSFEATTYPCFVFVDKYGHIRYRGKYPADKVASWTGTLAAEAEDPGPNAPLLGVGELNIEALLSGTKLPDLDGETIKLGDCMGKGGLMLVFVDTKCPFSAVAIEELPQVAKTLSEQDTPVVLINIGDPRGVVRKFYADKDVPMVLWDATMDTGLAWDVHSVPTVVYVKPPATSAYRGSAVWSDVATAIETALSLPKGTIVFTAKGTSFG